MGTLLQDLRYAIRVLLKSRSFTVAAVVALALGIGANTAIFSVVNGVLLRPFPYKDPEQIAFLWTDNRRLGTQRDLSSYPNFEDWRDQNQAFQQLAAIDQEKLAYAAGAEPEEIKVAFVSTNFFPLLGVSPALGLLPGEERPGSELVAVISYGLWLRSFGGDTGVIGKTVTVVGRIYRVVGVMPRGFQLPEKAELWTSLDPLLARRGNVVKERGFNGYIVLGRLKPGVSLRQAQADMRIIANRLERQYPKENAGLGVDVVGLRAQISGHIRPALLVLQAAVALVLLIACANVANLLLARAATRQKEIAIRSALGASRLRIVSQLLTESVLLAVLGGGLGLVLAFWGVELLVAISPADIPMLERLGIDGTVLGFTLAVSLVTGVIFGLAPALQASKPQLSEALKEGGRSAASGLRGQRVRELLVVFEIALALVLLVGAGLLIESLHSLRKVNPGFNMERLLTMRVTFPRHKARDLSRVSAFFQQLLERLESLPGVKSAGAGTITVFDRNPIYDSVLTVEGSSSIPSTERVQVYLDCATPNYFSTMGIPLLKGRTFTNHDGKDAPPVVIISEAFARRYWPNEEPVGKRLKNGDEDFSRTVVGVVGDVRSRGLDAEVRPQTYLPHAQVPPPDMNLVLRTATGPLNLAAAVRREIRAIEKDVTISNIQTMNEVLADSLSQRKFNMLLLGIFAAGALILAALGTYGVMAYSVNQRTHEIGIRMALGAQQHDVLKLIVGQGMVLALIGVSMGLVGALALTRVMGSLLYGVSATDPVVFLGGSMLLALVSLTACYVPARRATKTAPMTALRYE